MSRALALALALVALVALCAAPAAASEPDPTAPAYELRLTGSEQGARWRGRETLTLTNPGATPLARVWVRLFL
ncbi:MAG TPA: hypothetical protein VEY49_01100, partial [Solirubrobacteraceae bacterium]|nr:hypothetical protein [Solirubrobacteraceae bacterium]